MQCQFLDTYTLQHQFIDWTKEELKELNGKMRKSLTSTVYNGPVEKDRWESFVLC